MKTIQFTGEEKHIEAISNFHKNTWINTNTLQKTEIRVYVVNVNDNDFDGDNTTDNEFMTLAENNGRVYTLDGFQEAFNFEEINSGIDVIRFINVPLNN